MSSIFIHSGRAFRSLGIILATALLVSILPPIPARADTAPADFTSLPVNITASPSTEYIGDTDWPKIRIKKINDSDYIREDYFTYYFASLYDLDTRSFVVGGQAEFNNADGTSQINLIDHYIPVGEHHYQVIIDKSSSSSTDHVVTNPVGRSTPFTFTRKPLTLSLSADKSTFSHIYSPYSRTTLNQKLNSEEYGIYTFDLTTGELVDFTQSQDNIYGADLGFAFGDPRYFQSFVAAYDPKNPVNQISDLKNILASSNVISMARDPWDVHIRGIEWDPSSFEIYSNKQGGGEYATYLVDNESGNIVWDNVDKDKYSNDLYRSNAGHSDGDYSWATAYIAETYRPFYYKDPIHYSAQPQKLSDLVGIQASSKGYSKASSGVSNAKEIAGGSNPSEPSSQNCHCDPINTATGEFFENNTDMVGTGSGLKAAISRSFSTTNKDRLGTLGYGWRTGYDMRISADMSGDNADPNILTTRNILVEQENGSVSSFYKKDDGSFEGAAKTRATLSYNPTSKQFTLVRNKTETFVFDSSGALIQIKNDKNQTVSISYANGKISTVTDNRGNNLTFAYNTKNLVSTITDQNGKQSIYAYDTDKNLIKATDAQLVVLGYTYDDQHRIVTLNNALGGVTTNTYNSYNQVTEQTDPLLNATTFIYNGDLTSGNTIIKYEDGSSVRETYVRGQLVSKTENYGTSNELTWKYSYDGANNLISVINPDGSSVTTLYDTSGNITSTIDSNGNKTTFTYDDRNNLTKVKDALDNETVNTYDGQNNLLSTTNPLGGKKTFTYNSDGTVATATDARGNAVNANPADFTSTFSYTPQGLATGSTDALGHKTRTEYDSIGRPTALVKPRGLVAGANASDFQTDIQYNVLNLPVKTIDPLKNETVLTYDSMGNVLTSKDALGNVTSYTYDLFGNMLTATNALGKVTSYHYDNRNRVDSITDPNGKISKIAYDTLGRVIQTTDQLGRANKQEWDANSRLTASIDGDGKRTTYTYDPAGNLLSTTDPLKNTTRFSYDALNRMIQTADAEGHKYSTEYDAIGRVTKKINPDATSSSLAYDAVGNVISSTNEAGKTEHWEYDATNKKTKYIDAMGKTMIYGYDADGNLITENRPDGSVVAYAYDTRDLNTIIDYPGTASDIAYTYDAMGRKSTEQKGAEPASTYTYDGVGHLTSRGPPSNKVSYAYDATGNISTLTYPSGRVVTYGYNDAGQMASLTTTGIGSIGFAYNNRGLPTETTLPNGIKETNGYDDKGQLVSVDLSKGTTSVYSKNQTYTAAGNVSQKGMSSDGATPAAPVLSDFTYDPLSRLTAKNKASDKSAVNTYAYDAVGNIVTNNGTTQTYDDAGKILSSGASTFAYDGLNNRKSLTDSGDSSKNAEYTWSANKTLSQVTTHKTSSPAQTNYSYDALGLLSSRTVGADSKNFVWDANSSIPRMLSDDDYEYIYGSSRVPLAQIKLADGAVTYLQTDLNGSVTALTDVNGTLAGSIDYSPYGVPSGVLASRFGYAGEWTDPTTGYVYLRARWLDTNTGNFLSEDPLAQVTAQSFGYTAGNPLQQIDPLGLFSLNPMDWAAMVVNDTIMAGRNFAQEAARNTVDKFNSVDWATVGTVVGTAATIAAVGTLFVATGGTAAIALGAIAAYGTAASATISGVMTYNECSTRGATVDCGWGIAGTVLSAIPLGRFANLKKLEEIATSPLPNSFGSVVEQGRANAIRMNARIAYGSINSAGTLTDFANRGRQNACR